MSSNDLYQFVIGLSCRYAVAQNVIVGSSMNVFEVASVA